MNLLNNTGENYIFCEIKENEISKMFDMIILRMRWMDEKGIKQWNVTKYDEIYPLSYYEEERKKGNVFVLKDNKTQEIVCGAVLKEEDNRWNDEKAAIYLHNFVSKINIKKIGSVFLQYAELYALQKGKSYFRLDSAESNLKLAKYYESHGFYPVGVCEDGCYKGVLRQKLLR